MITHTRIEILKILEEHPLLIIFLKKKKVYLKYIKYAMNPNWFIDHITSQFITKEIINYSFCWVSTPEGHEFWSNLNQEYKSFYNEY
jgi:hypothetical protein